MVSAVARLPIRLKLTLVFALVMALVLSGTGLFLYLQFRSDLDNTLDQGLRSRADDVAGIVRQADAGLPRSGRSPLVERGESFAQILDARGGIVDSTPQLHNRPLLTASQLRRAGAGTIYVERGPIAAVDERSRLLATPQQVRGRRLVVVVGSALDDRDDALANLRRRLLIGGPVALLLASLAGYGIAAAALRPVEAMRRQASLVSAEGRGQRLPVPPARDELHRLGETLNEMIARLEAAFARERTFVADASHELRTPLAILRTELELALREGRSEEELRDALRSASEETERLSQLAEDLLVIARFDQGRLPVRVSEIPVRGLLERVGRGFATRAESRRRSIEFHAPADLAVSADPLRLEQALGNMVDNALRHGTGQVTLAAHEGAGRVELHVHDEGPGFPEGFAEHAFERFTRGDAARGRGGSGLGLAIVAAIARAHGGSAHAANRPEGGADVWIEMPLSHQVHVPPVQPWPGIEPKEVSR
jgi:two-component system, OmpR family, sensor kinase